MLNKTYRKLFMLISGLVISTQAFGDYGPSDVCFAEPQNPYQGVYEAYPYATLGGGPIVVIPNIGIGYRQRFARVGTDAALSFSTIGYAHQLSFHAVGHLYLDPCRYDSMYVGLGVTGSGIFTNGKGCIGTFSPDFVFGKVLESSGPRRHFIEMHVGMPTLLFGSGGGHGMYLPLMYIKYGFSF